MRVDSIGREKQLRRVRRADNTGQYPGASVARHQTDLQKRGAKDRGIRCDPRPASFGSFR